VQLQGCAIRTPGVQAAFIVPLVVITTRSPGFKNRQAQLGMVDAFVKL
jgi:hypothetical protein